MADPGPVVGHRSARADAPRSVVQVLTQASGGPVDHALDLAVGLARAGEDSHVVGPPTDRIGQVRDAGVTWHPLAMAHKSDLSGARVVAGRLRELAPDVLHLHDRRAGWLGRSLVRGMRRTAAVYTLHGVPDGLSDLVAGNARAGVRRRRDAWYYLRGERVLARWSASEVIVPSRAVADYARVHIGLPDERVHVVPNGVDEVRFAPVADRSTSTAAPTFLWLGLLGEVKRLDVLLDVIGRVPAARVVIAGDGPLRDHLIGRIAASGLDGRVRFVGHVSDPVELFATADGFVLTSAAENCPLAVLQAMSCGLPVLATAVGGVPELVRDGLDGLLAPADDVDALAAALGRLATDPDLRRRLGHSARERVLHDYTLDRCVAGVRSVYDGAVGCIC